MKKILLFILTSILTIPAWCATTAISQAREFMQEHKWTEAIASLQEEWDKRKTGQAAQLLGECYYNTGNTQEAIKYFELAQKKGINDALPYLAHFKYMNYDFDASEELLAKYQNAMKRAKRDVSFEVNAASARVSKAKDMLDHVEKIIVVDSISVDKDKFFKAYRISPDYGTLTDGSAFPTNLGKAPQYVFTTGDGERKMWAALDSNDTWRLYESTKLLDGSWDAPQQEADLLNDNGNTCYPFMLPDGITLYYSADGDNSIGGYDILITRKDSETGDFMSPQNVGMPFNSPYNDYLLVIDNTTGAGWWATDRNQIPGKLTIYVFIPKAVRENYDPGTPNLKDLAFVRDYKSTQPVGSDFSELLSKINNTKANTVSKTTDFVFHLGKNVIYTSTNDAKSSKAKQLLAEWNDIRLQLEEKRDELKGLRKQFNNQAKGNNSTLSNKILTLENSINKLQDALFAKGNEVRQAEKGR